MLKHLQISKAAIGKELPKISKITVSAFIVYFIVKINIYRLSTQVCMHLQTQEWSFFSFKLILIITYSSNGLGIYILESSATYALTQT